MRSKKVKKIFQRQFLLPSEGKQTFLKVVLLFSTQRQILTSIIYEVPHCLSMFKVETSFFPPNGIKLAQCPTNLLVEQATRLLQLLLQLCEATALLVQLGLQCVALRLQLGVLAAQLLREAQQLGLTFPAALHVALEVSHLVGQAVNFLSQGCDFLCVTTRGGGGRSVAEEQFQKLVNAISINFFFLTNSN